MSYQIISSTFSTFKLKYNKKPCKYQTSVRYRHTVIHIVVIVRFDVRVVIVAFFQIFSTVFNRILYFQGIGLDNVSNTRELNAYVRF